MIFDPSSGLYTSPRLFTADLDLHRRMFAAVTQLNRTIAYEGHPADEPLPPQVEQGLFMRAREAWTSATAAIGGEILYNLSVEHMGRA